MGGGSYFYETGSGIFYTDAELHAVRGGEEKSLEALESMLMLPDDGLIPMGSLPVAESLLKTDAFLQAAPLVRSRDSRYATAMSITLDLPDDLSAAVSRCAARLGQTPNAFVAEALRRLLTVERFRERRERLSGYGPAAGVNTDDDVFAAIS